MKQLLLRFVPALALFLLLVFLAPRPMAEEGFQVLFVRVGTQQTDVTAQTDLERLSALLRQGSAWHFPHLGNPAYSVTGDTVTVTGSQGDPSDPAGSELKTFVFTVDRCFLQEGNTQYPIYNKEALWTAVLELVPRG